MNSIERRWSLSSSKGTCFRQWTLTLQKRIKKQHLNLFAAYWDTKTSKEQRGGFCIAFFFYLWSCVLCIAQRVTAGVLAPAQGAPLWEWTPTRALCGTWAKSPGRKMGLGWMWGTGWHLEWTFWHPSPCQGFETPLHQKGFARDIF